MTSLQVSTPFAISLGLGLFSTSLFTFANVGLTFAGPPLFTSTKKIKEKLGMDDHVAIKSFAWFYETAAPYFISASVLGTTSLLAAAYNVPQASQLRQVGNNLNIKTLLYVAAGFQLLPLPWTVIVMFPGIHKILDTRDSLSKPSTKESVSTQEVQNSLALIDTWKIHSAIRISFVAVSWAIVSTVAILA